MGRRGIRRRHLLAAAGLLIIIAAAILTLWAAPPGGLKTAHQAILDGLRWIDRHWLNAVAITALATTVLVAVGLASPFLARWLDRRDRPTSDKAARQRKQMLGKVRYKWITGVLRPSLAHAAHLALGMQQRSDAIDLGRRRLMRPGRQPAPLPDGTSIYRVFHDVSGALLIMGAPGAGKTTLLLQLAEELLEEAEQDPTRPIPVVLNLASWTGQELISWVEEELAVSYSIPKGTAREWVEQDALILLLDGLDEVHKHHRAKFAETINAYRRDHGLVSIAVCSRTQETQDLAVKLEFDQAVELLPPTDDQIDYYLSYLEAAGTPLADVRTSIATDQSLQDLLRSPLMLHVIALAYHGRPAPALQRVGNLEQRRQILWQEYVERMLYEHRPLRWRNSYRTEQAIAWLSWLAHRLHQQNQSEFRLDWLPAYWRENTIIWRRKRFSRWLREAIELLGGPVYIPWGGAMEADRFALEMSVYGCFVVPAVFGLGITVTGVAVGLLADPLAGLMAAVGIVVIVALAGWMFENGIGLLLLKMYSWSQRTGQNDRVWNPVNGAIAGFTGFAFWGTVAGVSVGFWLGPLTGLIIGLWLGLWFGLSSGPLLSGSSFVQHYGVRVLAVCAGVGPWRYRAFLDAMTERLLLRHTGGSYLFVHRMLLDYLAARTTNAQATAAESDEGAVD